jgi:hypothetical protein
LRVGHWKYKKRERRGMNNASNSVKIGPLACTIAVSSVVIPRSWVETVYPTLTYFNEVDRGGHFAAWEQPQLFSEEVRAAFRPLRSS